MDKCLFIGFSFLTVHLFAQDKDTTMDSKIPVLKEIVLSDDKLSLWAVGSSVLSLPSLRDSHPTSNLASLLSSNSHVRIRSYGAGGLVSASFRGANASHTKVLWNGVNLNHSTTGQYDLSLVPVFFVDELKIQSGGLASLLGEGTLGGSLHFQNHSHFGQGCKSYAEFAMGSFGLKKTGFQSQFSNANHAIDFRYFYHTSDNDFTFRDPYLKGQKRTLEHASFSSRGLQTSYSYLHSQKLIANIRYWRQETFRELAPVISEAFSVAEQYDQSDVFVVDLAQKNEKTQWKGKVSYQYTSLMYDDSLKDIHSKHQTYRFSISQDFQWKPSVGQVFRLENSIQLDTVSSTNFNAESNKEVRYTSGLNYLRRLNENILLTTSLRQEMNNSHLSPFLPSVGAKLKLHAYIFAELGWSKSYKRPSLNDKYWTPGGNPDLVDEMGWMSNIKFTYHSDDVSVIKNISLSSYYGKINDWIVWVPSSTSTYWSPKNIANVEQMGIELEAYLESDTPWGLLRYENTSSCQYISDLNAADARSKQLIYVPVFQFNQKFSWSVKKTHLYFQNHFESVRYTSADHSSYLAPYSISSLGFNHTCEWEETELRFGLELNNLWDVDYQLVQDRPMPGRHLNVNFNLYL